MQDRNHHVTSQNDFYLFTDKAFDRVELQKILAAACFSNFDKNLYLVKNRGSAGGALERYIASHGKVYTADTDLKSIG